MFESLKKPHGTREELAAICIRIQEAKGEASRCCNCHSMTDGPLAWVEDSVRVGDPLWSVEDRQKQSAWNGHFSGWCLPCAFKLLANKEPRTGPPPPAPRPIQIPEFEECGANELTKTLVQKGGGLLQFIPTERGVELLRKWDMYHDLAIAGMGSYNETQVSGKILGLILLDINTSNRPVD